MLDIGQRLAFILVALCSGYEYAKRGKSESLLRSFSRVCELVSVLVLKAC